MWILQSMVMIHKLLDTVYNRFIQMDQKMSEISLENSLAFMDFGKYKLANANVDNYFTKLNSMCNQYIDINSSEEGSETDRKSNYYK